MKDGPKPVLPHVADVFARLLGRTFSYDLPATLADGFEVVVVDRPREEEIEVVMGLTVVEIENATERRLDVRATQSRLLSARRATGHRQGNHESQQECPEDVW